MHCEMQQPYNQRINLVLARSLRCRRLPLPALPLQPVPQILNAPQARDYLADGYLGSDVRGLLGRYLFE